MNIHLSLISSNKKTGLIPVSTSDRKTCPSTCPLLNKGCYAKLGHIGIHWNKVSSGQRSLDWNLFLKQIRKFPKFQLWRHNQAGDLPGNDKVIDSEKMKQLVYANKGKRGFTYTHKPVLDNTKIAKNNRILIKESNKEGFTINLSANSIDEADKLIKLNIAPVATILDSDEKRKSFYSPNGNKIVVCPTNYNDEITCANCALCAIPNRKSIIGFPAHGIQKKYVDKVFKDK